ncbi:hypothetical protein [Nocardiopsis rhodophaea]|uniref:hypothetical protein n=1 Tax=Nocardiopsis rhodophaea TaxID=280238 RepID=UPI0031DC070A
MLVAGLREQLHGQLQRSSRLSRPPKLPQGQAQVGPRRGFACLVASGVGRLLG